jgi:hypothetical protein
MYEARKVTGPVRGCYGYRLYLFLRFWYLILEFYRHCGDRKSTHSVGKIPKSNIKIVERGIIDIRSTHINDRSLFLLDTYINCLKHKASWIDIYYSSLLYFSYDPNGTTLAKTKPGKFVQMWNGGDESYRHIFWLPFKVYPVLKIT